jgi:hypothetical protein
MQVQECAAAAEGKPTSAPVGSNSLPACRCQVRTFDTSFNWTRAIGPESLVERQPRGFPFSLVTIHSFLWDDIHVGYMNRNSVIGKNTCNDFEIPKVNRHDTCQLNTQLVSCNPNEIGQ